MNAQKSMYESSLSNLANSHHVPDLGGSYRKSDRR